MKGRSCNHATDRAPSAQGVRGTLTNRVKRPNANESAGEGERLACEHPLLPPLLLLPNAPFALVRCSGETRMGACDRSDRVHCERGVELIAVLG